MKPFLLVALPFAIGCTQAPAQNNQGASRPSTPANSEAQAREELMDEIERQVRLPEGAGPLASYARYYAWQQRDDGYRKVVAVFERLTGAPPGRRWVAETDFPLAMDGGCGLISLSYDVTARRIEHVACNGEG